jgi:DNA-binding CsgD family transcriptional regulator
MATTVEELEKIWDLCQGIELSHDRRTFEVGLLESTAELLGAETAVFRVFCRDHRQPVVIVGLGIRDRVHDAYLNRYVKLDPLRSLLAERFTRPLIAEHDRRPDEAWTDEYLAKISEAGTGEMASSSQARQDEFRRYSREFLFPNDFFHHLGFCFQDESGSYTFVLDYHRPEAFSPFDRLDTARAKILAVLMQARATRFGSNVGPNNRCDDTVSHGPSPACQPIDDFGGLCVAGRLSTRELEVAEVVARGLTNKQVGDALGISVRTVENHMRSIFTKLKISTRTRLAAKLHEMTPVGPATRRGPT